MIATTSSTLSAVLSRLIEPDEGSFSPAAARAILKIQFAAKEQQRMKQLAMKLQADDATDEEQREIDHYNQVGNLLALLHSKARRSLKPKKTARSHG
jgi:hypothetical protein